MQLEELRRKIEEDNNADIQCQQLDAKAREAQLLQEEATKAREALFKRLDISRRLMKVENEWKIAKLVHLNARGGGRDPRCHSYHG